jgi:hypothetical protein
MDIRRKWHLTINLKKIENSGSFHRKDNSILSILITRERNSFLLIQKNFSSWFEIFIVRNQTF